MCAQADSDIRLTKKNDDFNYIVHSFFHFKLAKNQTAKWAMAIDSDLHSNELLIYIYKFEKLNHLP